VRVSPHPVIPTKAIREIAITNVMHPTATTPINALSADDLEKRARHVAHLLKLLRRQRIRMATDNACVAPAFDYLQARVSLLAKGTLGLSDVAWPTWQGREIQRLGERLTGHSDHRPL